MYKSGQVIIVHQPRFRLRFPWNKGSHFPSSASFTGVVAIIWPDKCINRKQHNKVASNQQNSNLPETCSVMYRWESNLPKKIRRNEWVKFDIIYRYIYSIYISYYMILYEKPWPIFRGKIYTFFFVKKHTAFSQRHLWLHLSSFVKSPAKDLNWSSSSSSRGVCDHDDDLGWWHKGDVFHGSHRIHGIGILIPTWMVDLYGVHVCKYSSPMDPMGMNNPRVQQG